MEFMDYFGEALLVILGLEGIIVCVIGWLLIHYFLIFHVYFPALGARVTEWRTKGVVPGRVLKHANGSTYFVARGKKNKICLLQIPGAGIHVLMANEMPPGKYEWFDYIK